MARSKNAHSVTPPPPDSAAGSTSWPVEFASPRDSALATICLVIWGAILLVLARGNSLLGLKQAILVVAGARIEPILGNGAIHSVDIAIVLFGALLVIAGGYIHVSVGLAVILALRPWLDGFTYPMDNAYFLWASLYLLGCWAVRQFRDPKPFRGTAPLLLLALFCLYALAGTGTAIQLDTHLNELLLWCGYGALLVVAINGASTRQARTIILLGLLAGVAGQALFAFPHLYYVLPWLRNTLQADPELLSNWFKGATEFTPELARRFNLNRAFASMVFPNALAALLLLGITPTIALFFDALPKLRREKNPDTGLERPGFTRLLVVAVPLFSTVTLTVYALGLIALSYRIDVTGASLSPRGLIGLSVTVAAIPTVLFLIAARTRGFRFGLALLQSVGAAVFAPTMLGALWITYSRGAMLALLLAVLMAVLLHLSARRAWFSRTAHGALAGLLVVVLLGACLGGGVLAPSALADVPGAAPSSDVSAEGMDMTATELINPASFSARLGYWRVALRMALEKPWMGVGLGNFGMAYGPVQDLDAGDVRNAHSVVLQILCETGIPGLLLFCAFWGIFLWRAAVLFRERLVGDRLVPAGLAVALMAFLIHALIDINFSHPSLVMMAMVALGLFYRWHEGKAATDTDRPRFRQAGALALLVAAAICAGLMMRPYFQVLGVNGGAFINVSSRDWLETRQRVATFLLTDCGKWARENKAGPPPRILLRDLVSLVPDREMLFRLGKVLAPDPARGVWVEISEEQPLPPNGIVEIERPWDTYAMAMERVEAWAGELAFLDSRFPHNPDMAMILSQVYKLIVEQAMDQQAERKVRCMVEMTYWAEEAVRRSPLHKDMYMNLAWVHWTTASNRSGQESIDSYMDALDAFAKARELGHLEPANYFAHASALEAIGESYRRQGVEEKARAYQTESEAVRAEGLGLQEERWRRGLQ